MSWDKILGHDRVKKIFQRAIKEKKIPNAYLLWGTEGIGKDALALEFAKTVNCNSPIIGEDSISACDQCQSCRQISSFGHPNLQYIYSLPAGKGTDTKNESSIGKLSDDQIDEIKEQLALKAENPYHKINIPNANQIKIASIRDIKKNLMLTANTHGRRVAIISNAEEMTTEAANAFLKTLEEPHENITIILTSSKKEALLQTILSRCQKIHCDNLPDEAIANKLMAEHSLDQAHARLVATFAQGSYLKAMDFLQDDMQTLRSTMVDMLSTSLKRNTYRIALLANIEELTAAKNKNSLETALKILLVWMRDVVTLNIVGDASRVVNTDQAERIIKFCEIFGNTDLPKAIEIIEAAISKVRRNINPHLILLTMFIKLRKVLLNVDY